ncbi:O-antigen ligase family protein [Aminivibrio sp.]|uniref:O-antigen ligase family protein n=1 Tax=Aminivibrio sp. TaxID=1872489 RepID=UPI00345E5C52
MNDSRTIEQNVEVKDPLLPGGLFVVFFFISLVFPNLVFSGPYFYSTLHLAKWAVALVPVALCGIAAGIRIAVKGTVRTSFRIDGFAFVWLILLLYVTMQPFWSGLRSPETFFREWFFFASLWLAYILAVLLADRRLLRAVLWGSLVNCALSVVFAELQIRGANHVLPLILPTPGHYIANTGQQNMLALWLAMGGLNGTFLFFSAERGRRGTMLLAAVLLSVVFWGLISTTSRSGLLSLFLGFLVLSCYFVRNLGRRNIRRVFSVVLIFISVLGLNLYLNEGRWGRLMYKMEDIARNPLSIANRDSIWATSWTMYTSRPLRGVGLGQYKWHYLEAQREMLKKWPRMKWQYTHWAHNEFLQWFAEAGTFGGILMLFLWGWWAVSAFRIFLKKSRCSAEAFWASSMVALFLFDALWTRPFHRIENALWLVLAFAAANREMLLPLVSPPPPEEFEKGGRLLGGVTAAVCMIGLIYLGNGMWGDRMLRLFTNEQRAVAEREAALERALSVPMVRDLAEKEGAYYLISSGQERKDPESVSRGLNRLMTVFSKEPHVRELNYLRQWSIRLENEALVDEFTSYGAPASKSPPVSQ